MIEFDDVTVTYPDATRPALSGVNLAIPEGELVLVIGPTGSGKSTLLRAINGLVPHFTGGVLTGRVRVGGRSTHDHPPRELADLVGYVGQVPLAGFVTDTVEDELAYAMESLGVAPAVMRRRVEETLDLLGLADVRGRALLSLSAGQQQRVAIGSVLTVSPSVLVLDEPTSALDPPAAEEVLAAVTRLVHDLGLTAVVAEHRLERVVQYADAIVVVAEDGTTTFGGPAELLAASAVVPPIVELARLAGWSPVPLSVREARRAAPELRVRMDLSRRPVRPLQSGDVVLAAHGVRAAYGDQWALRGVDLALRRGEVSALMGRNGAGKSTLLSLFAGLRPATAGRISTHPASGVRVALVPQEPGDLLWAQTVGAECSEADRDAGVVEGTTRAALAALGPGIADDVHPRDLSEGQRLMLCLAVVLAAGPAVIALDEPTRGLDYPAKARLVTILRGLAAGGAAVLLSTHDVELVAHLADRVVVLADGEVVADGPTADVVVSSPIFAPQVAKVLAPLPVLTVEEVRAVLP